MREIFVNFALFVMLAVSFSGLSACSGSITANSSSNTSSPVARSDSNQFKSSDFPPLPTGIAQGELELLDGSKFKIADRKGKVLLLNLWATWCGPCRAEIPELVVMQEKYKDKEFQVIGLDVGDGEGGPETVEQIKTFGQKFKVNYELVRVGNEVTNEFYKFTKFNGIPISVLVDREGRIRGVFLGGGSNVIGKMKESVEKLVNEG